MVCFLGIGPIGPTERRIIVSLYPVGPTVIVEWSKNPEISEATSLQGMLGEASRPGAKSLQGMLGEASRAITFTRACGEPSPPSATGTGKLPCPAWRLAPAVPAAVDLHSNARVHSQRDSLVVCGSLHVRRHKAKAAHRQGHQRTSESRPPTSRRGESGAAVKPLSSSRELCASAACGPWTPTPLPPHPGAPRV